MKDYEGVFFKVAVLISNVICVFAYFYKKRRSGDVLHSGGFSDPYKKPTPLDIYVSNPNPVEDQPTEGNTPTCELTFEPKKYQYFCRGNCGEDSCNYRARMGAYVVYLCANCLLMRFLDLMVVEPLEAAGKS